MEKNNNRNGFQEENNTGLTLANNNNLAINSNSNLASNNNNNLAINSNGNLASNNNNDYISQPEIFIEPEDPMENMSYEELLRYAQELKATELARENLVIRAMADDLKEEELDEDLQESVENSRRAINPKYSPKEIGNLILQKFRTR